ncbi:hypothetical protein SAMN06296241_2038 [Salinimicrobium sediminis]|uniref:Uncharacterized protein n=1 Tax=Salinimicrobium sediminis TaxID=1343891 RepID=A0A285X5D9_9FLAO|nr:hypothetical protein [Salinimicrobium sediminis]SOC80488.1 hypothetical protein SAMN06296241_2038 [Salinimicrobium sediminis]
MMRIPIVALVLLTAFLSFQIKSSEFFLLAIVLLALIFLVVTGVIRSFKRVNSKYLKIPFFVIAISLFGIFVSLFRPYGEAVKYSGFPAEQLEHAYKTDQKDRWQLRSYIDIFSKLKERDSLRLQQVKDILGRKDMLKSLDKFHAAFVLHHSRESEDYRLAASLAGAAAEDPALKDVYEVQWLKKAAYDRWKVSIGEPEEHNSQNHFSFDVK